MVRSHLTLLR